MKYTLLTTVFLSALLMASSGGSADPAGDRVEVRQDRGEVRQDRRTTRDDAKDLATLREIQVELARARVESDVRAVAVLDARVMAMLQDGVAEGEKDDTHVRVAAEWAQLEGRYERQDLERRVLLLDELVDVARAEVEQDRGERREERRRSRDDRRGGGEANGHGRTQPRS